MRAELRNNTISRTTDAGIYLENLAGNLTSILENNLISDSATDGITMINGAGVNTMSVYLKDNRASGTAGYDYYFYNLGTLFELGATAPNPAIGQSSATTDFGVVADEGNTRFDGSAATVFIDNLLLPPSEPITITDKTTIQVP